MTDNLFLVDSHCHLDRLTDLSAMNLKEIIAQARAASVHHLLSVSTSVTDFPQLLKLTENFKNVSLSCGLHPLHIQEEAWDVNQFITYASMPQVVAIGETGLDYFRGKEFSHQQEARFSEHIQVACQLDKPLIVHTREASQRTIELLRHEGKHRCRGVIHCFTADVMTAHAALDLGFYLSFSGIVTFKNAITLREIAQFIPIDRLLIETDAPYLAPEPYRGKTNQPAYLLEVAQFIAKIRNLSVEQVATATTQNFQQLFNVSFQPEK